MSIAYHELCPFESRQTTDDKARATCIKNDRPRHVTGRSLMIHWTKGAVFMGYRTLADCVRDLEATGQLVVIDQEIDPYLEVAAVQRRVYQAGGPALLFRRPKETAFPLLGNLFGTLDRARYLFRDALESVRRLVELKVDPGVARQKPVAVSRRAAHALAADAPARQVGADPGSSNRDRPAATHPVLAAGWRTVHHLAAGLHRRPRPPRFRAVQPGNVPDPARG